MQIKSSIIICLIAILNWLGGAAYSVNAQTEGATLYVIVNGTGSCSSWTDACGLQSALGMSQSGDQIWVAAGTYVPTNIPDRAISFVLKSGVSIYGGFPAEGGDWDTRNVESNLTILSGEIGIIGKDDNSFHVVIAKEVDSSTILDGFTITGGNANGSSYPDNSGGGMFIENSSITVNHIGFSNNAAIQGGGMYNNQSSPFLNDVTFIHNTAGTYGGGMLNDMQSNPVLKYVTFSGNSANDGGGLYNTLGCSPTLIDVIFSGNIAINDGAGMYNSIESHSILTDVSFSGNSAGNNGGAIANYLSCSPNLTNVTISGNSAGLNGGGIYNRRFISPILTNVTIVNNTASLAGGGIYNAQYSNPVLTNVTIVNNTAVDSCGGICNNGASMTSLSNAILWGNTPDQIGNISTGSAIATFSDIQGGYAGTGNINADPLLGLLANNGGFTQTMALLKESPAVDAGNPDNCPTSDQRNGIRPVDGNEDGLSICDMGAYEIQGYHLVIFLNGQGDVLISPQKTMYHFGEEVTLTAIADPGWYFLGWSDAFESSENPLTITILGNTGLTVTFGNHRWFFPLIHK